MPSEVLYNLLFDFGFDTLHLTIGFVACVDRVMMQAGSLESPKEAQEAQPRAALPYWVLSNLKKCIITQYTHSWKHEPSNCYSTRASGNARRNYWTIINLLKSLFITFFPHDAAVPFHFCWQLYYAMRMCTSSKAQSLVTTNIKKERE